MNPRSRLLGVEPQFRVTDLVRTAEYYREALGFTLEGYVGEPPVFVQVSRDDVTLQLGLAREASQATAPAAGVGYNVYLWAEDVDRLAAEFAARGAERVEGPVDRVYRCRELVVRDCNGLVLCFAQDTSLR
jgi:predicted enzyme related to lactoylglutathione lyase